MKRNVTCSETVADHKNPDAQIQNFYFDKLHVSQPGHSV